jgi:competence protein ComEC
VGIRLFVLLILGCCGIALARIFQSGKQADGIYLILIVLLGMIAHGRYNFKDRICLQNYDFTSDRYRISGIVNSRRIYPDKQRIVLTEVKVENKSFSGKILVTIKNADLPIFNRDTLEYIGTLYFPDGARNPGEFDYKNYLERRNIFMLSYADKKEKLIISPRKGFSLFRGADWLKSKVMEKIDRVMSGEPANILKALVLGARDELEGETTEIFVYSGTIHILAVSGLHVAYVTMSLFMIFSFLRLPDKFRTSFTILGLVFYIFIVDFKPSVTRAVIMASLILVGKSWEKKVNVYNSLAAAGFIQLLISPNQLFDAGFQLSFAAVFSIVYFYRRISKILPEKWQPGRIKPQVLSYVYGLFLVSFTALIGTLPITAYYFNRISPVSLLANLFAIPIIGVVGAAGFAQVILGFFIHTVNLFYGQVNQLLIELLIFLTSLSASVPFGSLNVPAINLVHVLIFYLIIFGLFNLDKNKVKVSLIAGILVLMNLHIWVTILKKPQLEVVFFDVGQGDAALVKFPTGEKLLIDTADRTFSRHYAESVILPYFVRENIKKLDVMVLSHPHNDHIGGAPFLMENIQIDEIWESDVEATSKTFRKIHWLADSLKIPTKYIYAGDYFYFGQCGLFVLHPSRKYLATEPSGFNHYSTTIKLNYRNIDILFTGDIEKEDEAYVTLFGDFIDCEILKVPHHGSRTSSTEKFIQTVSPEIAFVSVGRRNKFRHPSLETMERYRNNGILIHRSDEHHALVVRSDGKTLHVR